MEKTTLILYTAWLSSNYISANNNTPAESSKLQFFFLFLFFLVLSCITIYFKYYKKEWVTRFIHLLIRRNQKNIPELEFENNSLKKRIKQYEDDISTLRIKIKRLEIKIKELENRKKQNIDYKTNPNNDMISTQISKFVIMYADTINDMGYFNCITKTPNEDSIYEIRLSKKEERFATFGIYKNAHKKILKNIDFIDGCDNQKINSNPISLIIEEGRASYIQEFGQWKITNKAKIKLI